MPNTRPSTAFIDGVCSACLNFARRAEVDWAARRADLLQLLDRHDGRCVVASSGGKDSVFIAVTLRDLFAACILIGTGWDRNAPGTWEGIAARCYAGADAMLRERDKPR